MAYQIPIPGDEYFKHRNITARSSKENPLKLKVIKEIRLHEHGFLIFYEGNKFPKKGFPYPEAILAIDIVKRFIRVTGAFLEAKPIRYFIPVFFMLPGRWQRRILWAINETYFQLLGAIIQRHVLVDKAFCRSAKEIKRIGYALSQKKAQKEKETVEQYAEFIAMIMEYDNAWRYRIQDIFGELDKEAFMENPVKEIERLCKLEVERETSGRKDFLQYLFIAKTLLFLKPKLKGFLKEIVGMANLEELKLDEADWYHCLVRSDYDYRGISFEDRMILRKQIDDAPA